MISARVHELELRGRCVMMAQGRKGHDEQVHYNHTTPSAFPRWTSRECYHFMYARPWQDVVHFYSKLVTGHLSLSHLFGFQRNFSIESCFDDGEAKEACDKAEVSVVKEKRTGRWERVTFKIVVSYHGSSFDGWQKQPDLNTVQAAVERCLGRFIDEKKAQQLKEKCLPLEGCAVVAGRTDKGVTALQQVCSFYTWRKDVKAGDIEQAVNSSTPGILRVLSVSEVSRTFHPNFSAKWRRYLYIFPLNDGEEGEVVGAVNFSSSIEDHDNHGVDTAEEKIENLIIDGDEDVDELENEKKPRRFSTTRVNQLLRQLEGKLLSYKMFARDTKASRSTGPPTECFIYHARATEARLPCPGKDDEAGTKVMCVELVGNRFLRKMVRVVVATSIREAAVGAEEDSLIKLMEASCRRATAPPAPPEGLCLYDVGYTEFNPKNCLIS